MTKTRPFSDDRIELCRNCHGAGFVQGGYNAQAQPVCPVCQGSGRVNKTIVGTVTITPYEDDNSN